VILTAPDFARALRPDAVAETAEHPSLETVENLSEALERIRAASPDTAVFITGSLYLVGEARALLVK
jgi:dihydrofolate synthase/folylpolyglutamate synthase